MSIVRFFPLLGPAVVEDEVNEVRAHESGVEVRKDVVVHGAEGGVGAVFHAVVERCQDALLELRARVGGDDGGESVNRKILAAEAQHIRLHTGLNQSDLVFEELRHARRRVQRDAQPHLARVGLIDAALQQEIARRVGAVDLEAHVGAAVALGQAEVMKHGRGVQQLEVRVQPATTALQRAEQEHPPRMVEEQIVFRAADVVGDLADQRGVRDDDVGDAFHRLSVHDRVSFDLTEASLRRLGADRPWLLSRPSHKKRHNGCVAGAGAHSRVVVIVVFDGVTLLDVAGAGEVFVEANRFGADYQLKIASVDGGDVTTSLGTRLGVTDRIAAIDCADTIMVAGSDNLPGRAIDPALVEAVRSVSARTRRMASICTGSFILAQAGLLRGRRATTHWNETRLLGRAFRDVTVEPDAIFVRDGDVFTSAGVSSGIDLALALVELDYGSELVRDVARWLVVYLKRAGGQSQFSVLVEAQPPPRSPLRAVTEAIAADPADHSVKRLAAHASLSTRQLTRLFASELGMSPAQYVELVRVDFARAALEDGRTVAETAGVAGFGSTETLRRVFTNRLGISPKAYRDRFRTACA